MVLCRIAALALLIATAATGVAAARLNTDIDTAVATARNTRVRPRPMQLAAADADAPKARHLLQASSERQLRPTKPRVPASCPKRGYYRAPGGCKPCDLDFQGSGGNGRGCAKLDTLSRRSRVCTASVLPAFPSWTNPRLVARCINPRLHFHFISLVTHNGRTPQVADPFGGVSYDAESFLLDGALAPAGPGSFVTQAGRRRRQLVFNDPDRRLLAKSGKRVRLTGLVIGPGRFPNTCIMAYLKVC